MDSPEPPPRPTPLSGAATGADAAAAAAAAALAPAAQPAPPRLPPEAAAECEAALRDAAGVAADWTLAHERGARALPVISWALASALATEPLSLAPAAAQVVASVPSPFVSSWVQCGGRFADRDLDAPARLTLAIQSLEGSVRTAERLAPELAAIFTRLLRALRLASGAVEGPFGPTSGEGPRVGFLEEPSASAAAGAAAAASGAAAPPAAVEPESQPAATGRGSGVQGSAASEAAEAATPEPDRRASGRGAERESRDSRRGRSPTSRRGRRGDPDDEGEAAGGEERRGRAREGGRRAAAESPTPAAGAPEGAGVAPSAEPPPAAAGPAAFASGGAEAQAAPAAAEAQRCSAAEVPADQGPRDWDWGPLARDPLQGISTDVLSAAVFGRPLADWVGCLFSLVEAFERETRLKQAVWGTVAPPPGSVGEANPEAVAACVDVWTIQPFVEDGVIDDLIARAGPPATTTSATPTSGRK